MHQLPSPGDVAKLHMHRGIAALHFLGQQRRIGRDATMKHVITRDSLSVFSRDYLIRLADKAATG